jgi:hypothetical protein
MEKVGKVIKIGMILLIMIIPAMFVVTVPQKVVAYETGMDYVEVSDWGQVTSGQYNGIYQDRIEIRCYHWDRGSSYQVTVGFIDVLNYGCYAFCTSSTYVGSPHYHASCVSIFSPSYNGGRSPPDTGYYTQYTIYYNEGYACDYWNDNGVFVWAMPIGVHMYSSTTTDVTLTLDEGTWTWIDYNQDW